jgi:hypothetical protein
MDRTCASFADAICALLQPRYRLLKVGNPLATLLQQRLIELPANDRGIAFAKTIRLVRLLFTAS